MARANTPTLLSLDEFASILGLHPLHFNQVVVDNLAPATTCGQPFVQYSWQQADSISREEIAQAIDDAERQIAMHLGFKLRPTWEIDTVPYDTLNPYRVKTNFGYVAQGGQETLLLVSAGAAIVYTDADSDTYPETATISIATSVTTASELHIYYPGHYGAKEWEIPTTKVTVAGGVATIITRRERLITEPNLEMLNPRAVDGLVNSNFLTTVDVYRVYNDPAIGVTYRWSDYLSTCGCSLSTCSVCSAITQDGCLVPQEHRLGLVRIMPATWDAALQEHTQVCFSQCGRPDFMTLFYQAGLGLENGHIYNEFRRAITYYAVSLLDRQICACDHIDALSKKYQTNFALVESSPTGSNSFRFSGSGKKLDNPLGTTEGAMYAWRFITRYKLGEVVCGR